MSGQYHSLIALPLGKKTPVPTEQEFGWAPELVWTLWTREKFLPPPTVKVEICFQIQIELPGPQELCCIFFIISSILFQ